MARLADAGKEMPMPHAKDGIEAEILAALREVDDAELGVNIVDLGLVISCVIAPGDISIRLMMTTPTCPLGRLIAETAAATVGKRLGPDYTVHVQVERDAHWSPDLASPEVRARFAPSPFRPLSAAKAWLSRLAGAS
jgi:metal-sulfur cluster biosynthetic enzyme